jgi:thioredoxin-like negative regulator of GroEL
MLRELTDADFAREVIEPGLPFVAIFSSPWCGVCLKVTPRVQALADAHPQVGFGKVDISACARTASSLGVLALPAVLFFRDGAEKARCSGNVSEDELLRALEQIL